LKKKQPYLGLLTFGLAARTKTIL